jgi:hypothetical protein
MYTFLDQNQVRVLAGAVASGTSTLSYRLDILKSKVVIPPTSVGAPSTFPVNPNVSAASESNPLGVYEERSEGFDELTVLVHLGAVANGATTRVELYQVNDLDGTAPRLIERVARGRARLDCPALTATTDDNKVLILDVNRPTGRFFEVRITRSGAAVALNSVLAVLSQPGRMPVSQDSASVRLTRMAYES